MKLRVEPADGPAFPRTFDRDSLIIGRASSSDLCLADPFLSRHHARLYRDGDQILIEDLGSRNGTELNGQTVLRPTPVRAGDVVRVSSSRISFFEEADLSSESTALDATVLKPASELLREADTEAEPSELTGVEELRSYASRLRMLNRLHEGLSRSIEPGELLSQILDTALDLLLAEQGVLFLRSKDVEGEYYRAVQHSPSGEDEIPMSRALIQEVCDKGMAALVLDTATDERFAGAQSIIMSGMRSLVAAPLLDGNSTLGMIVLCSKAANREFAEDDLEFLVSLASIAALRIRNSELAEEAAQNEQRRQELVRARRIQESTFREIPPVEGYEIFAQNLPSRGVSGDYYRVMERSDGKEVVMLVADVSGKGIEAAMLTSSLEALSVGPIEDGLSTAEVCDTLARRLHQRSPPEKYATAFLAVLEPSTGRLSYTNAGHNPALVVRGDGTVEQLCSSGMPLGLVAGSEYVSEEARLSSGDVLVIYTDGVTEAENPHEEQYGLERLELLVREHRDEDAEALTEALNGDLETFVAGVPLADDCTVLVARCLQ